MYFVYVLLLYDKTLYKGSTPDFRSRFQKHQTGEVPSTKFKRPMKLIHIECYAMKSDAIRREQFLKTTEGRRLLRQQLRDLLEREKII